MKFRFFYSLIMDKFIREPKLLIRHYTYKNKIKNNINCSYIFMVDGRFPHGGMFDRFKGAITIYALSKIKKIPFKINYTSPFNLDMYLLPNKCNWNINSNEIYYTIPHAKLILAYGEYQNPFRLFHINFKKQIHFYYGYDSLNLINQKFSSQFEWGALFSELFKPSPKLRETIDYHKIKIGIQYITIHFRFQNLLGDSFIEKGKNKKLNKCNQNYLIENCRSTIQKLILRHIHVKAFIVSDSNKFLDAIKDMDNIYIIPGSIIHIDNQKPNGEAEILKPFLDFYLISESIKVYAIKNIDMYQSAFPEYAAKINNVPFERILI